MSTGTEVEYVDDTGTVQTIQGQQGISTPVCYKLEREEGSVLVYESDDGLNWVLVTTIVLNLVDPVHIGLVVGTLQQEVKVIFDQVHLAQTLPPTGELKASFDFTVDEGSVYTQFRNVTSNSNRPDIIFPSSTHSGIW